MEGGEGGSYKVLCANPVVVLYVCAPATCGPNPASLQVWGPGLEASRKVPDAVGLTVECHVPLTPHFLCNLWSALPEYDEDFRLTVYPKS